MPLCGSHALAALRCSARRCAPPATLSRPPSPRLSGLPVITARLRAEAGSNFSAKLRRARRTPGQLFSLPGERSVRLDMATTDAAALVRQRLEHGVEGHPAPAPAPTCERQAARPPGRAAGR